MASQEKTTTLHQHKPRPHEVRNANHVHRMEKSDTASAGGVPAFNQRIAVFLTMYVGTMWTAYGFAALAIVGLFGVLAIIAPSAYTLVAWLSQTFIQLVLLPVIMVGQNVLNHHAELQADEQFKAVKNSEHDIEQVAVHLSKQDDVILQILHRVEANTSSASPPTPAPKPRSHHKKPTPKEAVA